MHLHRRLFLAMTTVVCLCFGIACSDDDSNQPNLPIPHFDPPASSCEVPEPPSPLQNSQVVGVGTPVSCTENALRTAVAKGGNISFDCGNEEVTIAVRAEIVLSQDVIIDGSGLITLDGGGQTRIFHSEARVAVTVMGLTFINGRATATLGGIASGGAIRTGWLSTLNVFDCAFADNHAAREGIEGGGAIYQSNGGELLVVRSSFVRNSAISGGAIDNLLSPMTLISSTFQDNESFAGGGAIYDDGASADIDDDQGGTINICGCHFETNRTLGTGGAVYLWAYAPDRFIINQCSFIRNETHRPSGGSALGGALRTGNAPLQLANSLFAENHADVHGGAYWTDGAYRASISNCTFYQNNAGVEGQEGGYGGALSGFNMELINLTFVENHAEFTGGAISSEGDEFTLNNSVFLNNTSSNEWGLSQTCTDTIPGEHTIQWPASESDGDPPCTADSIEADPMLGELSDNGGATRTIPLLEGSPAIDSGDNCSKTDQRGQDRVGHCDLGAFESEF